MSEAPDKDQQTEKPTAKRLEKAKKDGDLLQSRELQTALVVAAGAVWISVTGAAFYEGCRQLILQGLTLPANIDSDAIFAEQTVVLLGLIAIPTLILLGLTFAISAVLPMLLGNFSMRFSMAMPKAKKINPISGLKRMFGVTGLIELGKSIAKTILLGAVLYYLFRDMVWTTSRLSAVPLERSVGMIGDSVVTAVIALSVGLIIIALIDVPIQYMRRQARLRMAKHELKQEMKESDGSPEVKQAQHRARSQILSQSAREAVPQATVILTNPTHFAVAIRYRPDIDRAPVIVAKGRDSQIATIKELASAHNVPILSQPQLTRAIYYTSQTGEYVDERLFMVVATVLSYIFNLDRILAEGGAMPDVTVPKPLCFDADGVPEFGDAV